METLVIANQKGGVGKTTISVNIAAGIHRQFPKAKILAVDIDPQGNLTYHFLRKQEYTDNIARLFETSFYTGNNIIYRTRFENLDVIPSDIQLASKEFIAGNLFQHHMRLKKYLDMIGSAYDIAIVDTPPSLGYFALNAFMAADWILVPAVPEKLAVSGIIDLFATLEATERANGISIKRLGVMPVMVDRRYKSHKNILKGMKKQLKHLYREDLMLNTNAPLKDATAKRKTIYEHDIKSNSYKQFLGISKIIYKEVLAYGEKEETEAKARAR